MKRLLTKKESEQLKSVERRILELKKVQEKYKEKLLNRMNNFGLKKVEIDDITFTVKDAFDRTDLDKKKLQSDFPELVEKYSKTTHVAETLIIKL